MLSHGCQGSSLISDTVKSSTEDMTTLLPQTSQEDSGPKPQRGTRNEEPTSLQVIHDQSTFVFAVVHIIEE